jgi:hypothetical protein
MPQGYDLFAGLLVAAVVIVMLSAAIGGRPHP